MTGTGLPLISIVTVVRNNAPGLEKTMDSVRSLDYPSVEYIVVDGGSTDGTRDVIQRRQGEICRWISEPDQGIYDAMNKGVGLASGGYVCFMNAGDVFASPSAVTRMFVPPPKTELIWGDCIVHGERGEEYDPACRVLERLHRQMTVCHQSLFTRRSSLLARPFNKSFQIAADYDFLCERLLAGASWEYRALPVSRIDDAGVSAIRFRTSIREKRQIALSRFPRKRVQILVYYLVLSVYMSAKTLFRWNRGR